MRVGFFGFDRIFQLRGETVTYQQLLDHYGGKGYGQLYRAARKLRKSKNTLAAWKRRGIPLDAQAAIAARKDCGKLRVGRA